VLLNNAERCPTSDRPPGCSRSSMQQRKSSAPEKHLDLIVSLQQRGALSDVRQTSGLFPRCNATGQKFRSRKVSQSSCFPAATRSVVRRQTNLRAVSLSIVFPQQCGALSDVEPGCFTSHPSHENNASLTSNPQIKLTRFKLRLDRILCDVFSQILKLLFIAYHMIEWFGPEVA
jgi:hypothetical protein